MSERKKEVTATVAPTTTIDYPPYVNAYGVLPTLFDAIKKAAVPTKFNRDFMTTVLGLKSSSYLAAIPLLKKLDFIDQANGPTQNYKDYRDDNLSKYVMARSTKKAYPSLFKAHEYANRLSRQEVISKLITITGASEDDVVIRKFVAGTFLELCKLADFEIPEPQIFKPIKIEEPTQLSPTNQVLQIHTPQAQIAQVQMPHKLGISYTINLNLPATTDIEVFHAIFKSLKEHILND